MIANSYHATARFIESSPSPWGALPIISSSPAGRNYPAVFSFFVGQRGREENVIEDHDHGIKEKMIIEEYKEVKL
ncbi:MAG: hypothetical protein KAS16_05180 [Thermoplasmata archaeon]|nr:hypothetical protein [Thermoplasmata archaeon]